MKNNELLTKYNMFFGETPEEVNIKIDEVKEVVINQVTKSQKKPIMSEEEFDKIFNNQ